MTTRWSAEHRRRVRRALRKIERAPLPDYLTVREAARLLCVSGQRVRQLCQDGTLGARRPGRDWLIPREHVLEYARSPRKPGPRPTHGEAPPTPTEAAA